MEWKAEVKGERKRRDEREKGREGKGDGSLGIVLEHKVLDNITADRRLLPGTEEV